MTATITFDASGRPVFLGKEIGRGGEGAVFDIQGQPQSVAKLYLKPPGPDQAAKILAMAAMSQERLLKLAAWPTATIHSPSSSVVGFVMPKVSGHRPVFQLYGPKLRLQEFPKADWSFLIHAAANTARAFALVHDSGLVVGDVNHGNLVVAQNAVVRFIDCDSFQVTYGGKRWPCEVGVGTHQPPEMQNVASYKDVVRTPNHDNFGLAVLIFQLLCMARHPFFGRYLGPGEQPSIEQAIERSRYAYTKDRQRTQMAPPPSSLPIEAFPIDIQRLFEQAFAPSAVHGGRPTGENWTTALEGLGRTLRQCTLNQAHKFPSVVQHCPWCDIEATSGAQLFPIVFVAGTATESGMALIWQEVEGVPAPPPLPPMPDSWLVARPPTPEALGVKRSRIRARVLTVIAAAILGLAIVSLIPPSQSILPLIVAGGIAVVAFRRDPGGQAKPFRDELRSARQDWEALRSDWNEPETRPTFKDIRASLENFKAQYDALPAEHTRRLQKLSDERQKKQMEEHLDRFSIASAKIPGIGRATLTTLQAHGIDTAGDVYEMKIRAIKGFGEKTASKLLVWRRDCESKFHFDPRRGIAPSDLAALERDITMSRRKLEAYSRTGIVQLKAAASAAIARARFLEGKAAELAPRLSQALANAEAIGVKL